jgi:hypothetical protein
MFFGCLAGCERDREAATAAQAPTQQELFNSAKLESAPPLVQRAFRDQFPEASVLTVTSTNSAGGPRLYNITFNNAGITDRVTYDETGALVSRPAAGDTNVTQSRPGFPESSPQSR